MYSVSTFMNRYVEPEKQQESYIDPFPCLRFTGRQKKTGGDTLLQYVLSETVRQHLDFVFVVLLFGSEGMLTTQPKVSFVEFLVVPCPHGWFAQQSNYLCIPEKDLFDDALSAVKSGFNNYQRGDTVNILPFEEFGKILPGGIKNTSLERGISTYDAEKQGVGNSLTN
jgi:hypothetical protein